MADEVSLAPPSRTTFLVGPDPGAAGAVWRFLLLLAGLQSGWGADDDGEAAGQGFGAVAGEAGAAGGDVAFGCDVCWVGAVCANPTVDARRGAPDASNHAIIKTIVAERI